MKFLSYTLLFTLCIGLFTHCGDDDDLIGDPSDSFIQREALFGCMDYTTTVLEEGSDDFRIKTLLVDGDRIFFGGFAGLILREGVTGTNQILLAEGIINRILKVNQDILIAGQEGLFAVDPENNIRQISTLSITEMILTLNGEVLIGLGANTNGLDPAIIYQIDPMDGTVEAYTENRIEGPCSNVGTFVQSGNGDIWAISCGNTIVHFADRRLVQEYTIDNSPLNEFHIASNMWLTTYEGDPIFVGKNGVNNYQIMKFKEDEWIELKNFATNPEPSAKEIFMRAASITDLLVRDDFLYISTTLAGCRGVQRFNLATDTPLEDEDFTVFFDPGLPEQCIQGMFIDPVTGVIYVYDQLGVTLMDGC